VALETVYIHYLGEAARRLGARWDDDRVSFADVTIGTGRIFAIMTALRAHASAARPATPGRVALFATVPGEEHRLGVAMATDLFRDAGWHIESLSGRSNDDILAAARTLGPAFVGLSASAERALPALAQIVIALKIALPETLILVSGPIVDIAGEVVAKLGADFVTADLAEARTLLDAAVRPAP
jgi:methanogenic corrinoid protein MtbC1